MWHNMVRAMIPWNLPLPLGDAFSTVCPGRPWSGYGIRPAESAVEEKSVRPKRPRTFTDQGRCSTTDRSWLPAVLGLLFVLSATVSLQPMTIEKTKTFWPISMALSRGENRILAKRIPMDSASCRCLSRVLGGTIELFAAIYRRRVIAHRFRLYYCIRRSHGRKRKKIAFRTMYHAEGRLLIAAGHVPKRRGVAKHYERYCRLFPVFKPNRP